MPDSKASLTYLVTGGAGFIGSHLSEILLEQGHRVLVIDDLSTGSLENLENSLLSPRFEFTQASILDDSALAPLAQQADVIVHLAAAVGVKLIVDRPVHTIETNIMGTDIVLKAALASRARVLLASTSEVYGKGSRIPFAEDDDVLLGPTSKRRWAYAASKMVDEFMGLAYQQSYGIEVVVFRLFNTVGPRQTGEYGMVIPRLARQALNGDPLTVYGNGEQSRCFCDVRDVVRAITQLAAHPEASGSVFNIGSVEEITILELAERIKELSGSLSPIEFIGYGDAYGPGFEDMQRRVPDTERIRALTGWRPRYSLDAVLKTVLEFEGRRMASREKVSSTLP